MNLTGEQARELLDSIDISTVVGLRDRALISGQGERRHSLIIMIVPEEEVYAGTHKKAERTAANSAPAVKTTGEVRNI